MWAVLRRDWRSIAVRTWREIGDDNVSLLAAGVAFYSFLAFVPMLAAVVLIYGLVADPAEASKHAQVLLGILPTDAAQIVGDQLTKVSETPTGKTAFGLALAIVLALYGAMRAATSIIGALNAAYDRHETRGFFKTTLISFTFTAGTAIVGVIAILAIGAMSLIGTLIWLPPGSAALAVGLPWIAVAVIAMLLIGCVYRYGPDRPAVPWRWLLPGIVVAGVGALSATFLFGVYVSQFGGYNATYGALGTVVSFLMWLYLSAFLVLVGAELNSEIEQCCAGEP
ncbi:MAG: YihY/virulence factor BrkB family protein [Novosphingobium sp.]